jgi:chemotaxis protein methyltransferase WspC
MDTSLNNIKQLLKEEIGLDASTVGEATIKKFLGQRMRACKLDNIDDYYNLLAGDHNELSALLETAVIPETWFFRDARPYTLILKTIRDNPLKYANNPCNILSIPCSTGEEPYTIAMYLLQESIPATKFRITAVDISQQALAIALQGAYGNNSFRGRTDQKYIDRFFSLTNNHYLISDQVRQCISFKRVNILDITTLPQDQLYDFILCRNLLIYFDVKTKFLAFNNLHKILKDDGVLFIGHSEFGAVPINLFSNTGTENAFGLIKFVPPVESKIAPTSMQPLPVKVAAKSTNNIPPVFIPASAPASAPVPTPIQPEIPVITTNKQGLLMRAQQLADEGKMQDAEECCLQHLEQNGDNCESFFLLALINESSNRHVMAEEFYRKAIYLNPKHYQSLVHLSLLLEKNGDKKAAMLLKQRAERALKK